MHFVVTYFESSPVPTSDISKSHLRKLKKKKKGHHRNVNEVLGTITWGFHAHDAVYLHTIIGQWITKILLTLQSKFRKLIT